jgi:hypothetical protein
MCPYEADVDVPVHIPVVPQGVLKSKANNTMATRKGTFDKQLWTTYYTEN